MTINSYAQAEAKFAKARNKTNGKPLGVSGWRLFKDGDDYVVNCYHTQVARLMPNNHLRIVITSDRLPPSVTSYTSSVLPIGIVRRTTAHYRVHPKRPGSSRDYMTASNWDEFRTEGYRLYDGLTIDLTTRTAVGYKEPELVVDTEARKQWLRDLKRVKAYLKTVAKLGGFDARYDALKASGISRWSVPNLRHGDVAIALAALDGTGLDPLVIRLAELMFLLEYSKPTLQTQLSHIDNFFTYHSLALRKARGVVEQQ